ncbi:MAG: hypothetical protein ACRDTR_21720 [Rubrobacter sp.]
MRLRAILILVGALVTLLLGVACSAGEDGSEQGEDGNDGRDQVIRAQGRSDDRVVDARSEEPDGGLGEAVEVGSMALRVFEVRARDRIYAIPRPGAGPTTRGGGYGEFVAVDYVARNVSGSPVTTSARATLVDDHGNTYGQGPIEPPAGGTDGMKLGTGQKRASTMFFQVPNGISPELLEVRAPGDVVRIDLLESHRDEIPPEDYLHVYHLYFNERAGEEAYEMLDPTSLQDLTLGEWLSFYEPLWGKRYLSLDGLRRVSVGDDRATFEMERTIYDADGDPMPDPEIDASVVQEMVKDGDGWQLVLRDDLVSDIIAVIGPDPPPTPETTAPEETTPEDTAPEETSPPEETTPETTEAADEAPEETLATQYELVNAGDYGAAYDLFDAGSQQLVSSGQYGAYFESVAPYEITSYSFSSVQVEGETAILVVDLTVSSSAGVERYTVTQQMVLESDSWRAVMREEQVAAFRDAR